MWIKIGDLPTDSIAQSVERLRDKPKAWVRILAIVRFFICSVFPLFSDNWRNVGRSNLDRVLHNLIMLILKRNKK